MYLEVRLKKKNIRKLEDDDDGNPGVGATVSFAEGTSTVTEGNATTNIPITLSAPAANDVVISFNVAGTATNGADFTVNTASPINIGIGQSTVNINITIIDDANAEGDETIILNIDETTGALLTGITTHTVTIQDNDNLEIFIGNLGANSVSVFNQNDNGDIAPKRNIIGGLTTFNQPRGLFVINNEIFVANRSGNSVLVFNQNDNGNVAPKRNISGAATNINNPGGVFVTGGEIFVANEGNNSISVFNQNDNGNVAPKRTITGGATTLNFPVALFVVGGEIFVAIVLVITYQYSIKMIMAMWPLKGPLLVALLL